MLRIFRQHLLNARKPYGGEFCFCARKGSRWYLKCIRFISEIFFRRALVIFELVAYPLLEKYAAQLDFCHLFEICILELF